MINPKHLKYAFRLMRRHGLFAEQNYSCCGPCGRRGIPLSMSGQHGWAFYDCQDDEAMKAGLDLHIGFGAFGDAPAGADATRVGQLVFSCLTPRWSCTCMGRTV